ncbi:L,D-transpeptidase/peptidoglycan binding protein [Aerococcaceae bacterium DSM 111020]|nr:L,D-transpeptidase/peptidoglycan binding protein [Aerococcaceae bacterium DSM 111020]
MKKGIIAFIAIVLLLVVGYGAGIGYFSERFQPNTVFAGVDISNQTLEEANKNITESLADKSISITENGNEVGTIQIAQLEPEFHVEEVLTNAYQSQNPNQWLLSFFNSDQFDVNLNEYIDISENALNQALLDIGLGNGDREPSSNASIEYTEVDGYHVKEAEQGNQLDHEKVNTLIMDNIAKGEDKTEINQAYLEPEITSDDETIQAMMEEINNAADMTLTLTISGEEETIQREQIMQWMGFDEQNQLTFDYDAIYDYLGTLNDKYATFEKPREFESTLRGTVTVEPGTLGWSIDREAETEHIIADLQKGDDVKREPTIVGTGYNAEGSDIGNTYVEVDIDNQTMFYYEDGEMLFETLVVTGQVGTDTVPGAYSIWDKQSPSSLRGYNPRTERDYVQPVEYWLPFDDTGQGIHDANWQANFGGDTYQVSGSLGCINTPPDAMGELFEMVELGTPVIVF